jgi:hypothetical protein
MTELVVFILQTILNIIQLCIYHYYITAIIIFLIALIIILYFFVIKPETENET